MAEIIDQIVKISIQDAVSSVTTVDVNTVAIVGRVGATVSANAEQGIAAFTPSTDPMQSVSANAVKEAYGADSELYAMAMTFFSQDAQPSRVVCIPLAQTAANTAILAAVQDAAEDFDFYHVVIASNDAAFGLTLLTDSTTGLQAWLADVKKVAEIQVADATALKEHGCDRVAVFQHTETHGTSKEFLNVAIVALRCAKDSARGTFAHKKCKGVTPDSYDVDDYNEWIDAGINIYVKVSGEARLFMGTTGSNETFLDQKIKDDWIRFNVQSRIYKLLGEGNDDNGVNYDDAGIGAVASSVLNVLTLAQDTDHQYVMVDSASVDYKPYSYIVENYAEDVRKRNLPLISGRYSRMNSIHTVVQVALQVTL
jgi:hypothetical protein